MFEMTRDEIDLLLANQLIGRLAMADEDGQPYAIPMPFCWRDGSLYLRLPMTGRKGRILAGNDRVCFEVDWATPDLSDYASVLVEGRLAVVNDLIEKRNVRLCNELKYSQLRGGRRKGHGRNTPLAELSVSRIVVSRLSGRKKEHTQIPHSEDCQRSNGCPVCGAGRKFREVPSGAIAC